MSWNDNLLNPALKTIVNKAIADGVLTYAEVLDLLKSAAGSGVTASEWSDLQSVYTNAQKMFASTYLKEISYSLIYGDVANKSWWGGSKTLSGVSALGNLSGGTSELAMNRLIGKWFLGTDLPVPVAGGDTATGKASKSTFDYATTTGALFVNGVAASDITQGSMGDCYLMAALGSIANVRPSLISDMFVDNLNGTYGVRYYGNSGDYFTTVNKSIVVKSGGSKVEAGTNSTRSLSGEMWVSLAEKAYVQTNMQFDVDVKGANWRAENSYQAIEGGWAQAFKHVGNLNYVYYSSYKQNSPDAFSSGFNYAANAQQYKQTIINALNSGSAGWMGSWGTTTGSNGKTEFVSGHAFMLLGYNASTDKFIFRNPWGGNGTGNYNVQFEASIGIFWNSSVKGLIALTNSSIANPVYQYSLSVDANSTTTAVAEGGTITVNISRSSSGNPATVFLNTVAGTAGSLDFATQDKKLISFAANELIKTISITTYKDSGNEGVENFKLNLTSRAADVAPLVETTAYIKDALVNDFTYTVTNSANSSATAVAEGGNISFTIVRSGSGLPSTVYLSTGGGNAGAADYLGVTKQGISFAANETTKVITIYVKNDLIKEGIENFSLSLYKNYVDTSVAATSTAYIKDSLTNVFNYSVMSNASSAAKAVVEGGKLTFTITRDATGAASTIYVSTLTGTAGNSDYIGYEKQAVYFAANQTIATVEVKTNEDWWLETPEMFRVALYKTSSDANYFAVASGYIKDAPASAFQYTLTATNSSADKAMVEGGKLSFVVTRSGTGAASTVYVSTATATADASDYASLNRVAVSFAAFETSKVVTVDTYKDEKIEGTEYLLMNLFQNNADSSPVVSSPAYIKDAPIPTYTYAITSSAGSNEKAVEEGGNVIYIITRSASGTASTVYVSTADGTALENDVTPLNRQAVVFAPYEIIKTVTVNTIRDTQSETTEFFWLNLYKNFADTDAAASAISYIKDAPLANYTYTVSTDAATADKAVVEGGNITVTVSRDGSGTASTVYLNTIFGTAKSSDYAPLDALAVTFAPNEKIKTLTIATYVDALNEGSEYLYIDLYKSLAEPTFTTFARAFIKDAKTVSYDYTITSSAANVTSAVKEGQDVSFTITRSASGGESTVYISAFDGTADSADFGIFSKQAIVFASNETSKVVKVNTFKDGQLDGDEYFWFTLYKNYSDLDFAAHSVAYITDTVENSYDYVLSTSAASEENAVAEGGKVTLTVTRSSTGTASSVYLSSVEGTAHASDFTALRKYQVNFAENETVKTITLDTLSDSVVEDSEFLWLELFKNYSDLDYATYAKAYIKDVAITSETYTITSSAASSDKAVSEGESITFTITRNTSGSAATVYLETADASATASDYASLSRQAINFASYETSKTISIASYQDSKTEGAEYFLLNLFRGQSDTSYAAYANAYIKDAAVNSYDYSISSNAADASTAAAEGGTVSFTITRVGSGGASTVYVSTDDGTTSAGDYTSLSKQAVSFAAGETSKVVTVNIGLDALSESVENFWLKLYKASSDTTAATSAAAYVKDFVAPNYDYIITTNSSNDSAAIVEGNKITITITRSAIGSASTVYISTTSGSANGNDYAAFSKLAVNFSATETVKIINLDTYTDNQNEGQESFWIDLFKNQNDLNYLAYTKVYINDSGTGLGLPDALSSTPDAGIHPPSSNTVPVYVYPNHTLGEYKNATAFAVLRSDGSVLSWGDPLNGGDSSAFAQDLNGQNPVTQIFSSSEAFAVLRQDGSVISWGNPDNGGDQSKVLAELNGEIDVLQIFSSQYAFAALRENGSVVTWGNEQYGGDSSAFVAQLNGTVAIKQIYSNSAAFAAVRADGVVVTWGYEEYGGNSASVAAQLNGAVAITAIYSTSSAFAALRADGSVVTWGSARNGGDSSLYASVLDGSKKVLQLSASASAFAVLLDDGTVVSWGDDGFGGDSSALSAQLGSGSVSASAIQKIYSTSSAFAALREDGTVLVWGYAQGGGALDEGVESGLTHVSQIVANQAAFAALRSDGSVVTWGDAGSGGDSSSVLSALDGKNPVTKIFATDHAFAALRADGSLVTWGDANAGGDTSDEDTQLNGSNPVLDVLTSGAAFVALHADGTIANWGDLEIGGHSGGYGAALANVVSGTDIYTDKPYQGGTSVIGSLVADTLQGSWGSDVIFGLEGDDKISGGIGHDKIDGGVGNDISLYLGNRVDFQIRTSVNGFVVSDMKGNEGIDSLTGMESMKFADMTINLTVGEKAKAISADALQAIVELYIAYFNRTPDADGMAYWIGQYQAGTSIAQIGETFYAAAISPTFSALTGYSASMTNADFIKIIYSHVLGRSEVDQGGMDYWSNSLSNGTETRASLIKTIINVAHSFKGNAEYGYVADLLDNKYLVGKYVAIEQGINYNTPEESYAKGVAIAALITATDTSAALALIGVNDIGFSLL